MESHALPTPTPQVIDRAREERERRYRRKTRQEYWLREEELKRKGKKDKSNLEIMIRVNYFEEKRMTEALIDTRVS